jgi:hypothetical protein
LTNYEDQLLSWKWSQNSSEYCQYYDLPKNIRSQLPQEDRFTTTIDNYRYTVKDYDGKWLVFRRNLDDVKISSDSKNSKNNSIIEIKIVPLNEANGYLRNESHEYDIFGNDPVKVVKDELLVVMVKRNNGPSANSKVN